MSLCSGESYAERGATIAELRLQLDMAHTKIQELIHAEPPEAGGRVGLESDPEPAECVALESEQSEVDKIERAAAVVMPDA